MPDDYELKFKPVDAERLKEAYKSFAESVGPKEREIKDWLFRSSNGPAKLPPR